MNTHRTEVTLTEDGSLTLKNLPFHAGDSVEVIIVARSSKPGEQDRYPLRGTPIHYDNPTEPVAQEDWEAVR
ncbi:MAG: hypothetical protein V7641_2717 [Blastocatellia bacterium]